MRPDPIFRSRQSSIEGFVLNGSDADKERQRKVLDSVRRYVAHADERVKAGVGLLFFGSVGSGKDHLLTAITNQCIIAGHDAVHVTGMDLWRRFRSTMNTSDGPTESEVMDQFHRPKILYISDPFSSKRNSEVVPLTDYRNEIFFSLLDWRIEHGKPTFLSVNVKSKEQFIDACNDRIVDRAQFNALTCFFNWPSYRKPFGG